jgi:transposase
VLISEDNVGLHHKARRLIAPEIKRQGIQFLDLPANSSDLHPIEQLHKDQKKLLEDYRFSIQSAAKEIQQDAKAETRRIWCQDFGFTCLVAEKADLKAYQTLAYRSKHAEPPYSNRYNDSI